MRNSLLLILAIFLCAACDMQQVIEFDMEEPEPRLVVEAYVEPGDHYKVLVSRTVSYTNPEDIGLESGAEVEVFNGQEWLQLREQIVVDTAYEEVYNYTDTSRVWPELPPGEPYRLRVKVGETLIEGEASLMEPVEIEKITTKIEAGQDSSMALVVEVNDPIEEANYYWFTVHGLDVNAAPTYQGLFTDEKAENGRLELVSEFRKKFVEFNEFTVSVFHLEPAYYEFLNSIEMATMANYNPYQEPATIKSTLDGGIGVFTALTVTRQVVDTKKLPHSGSQ